MAGSALAAFAVAAFLLAPRAAPGLLVALAAMSILARGFGGLAAVAPRLSPLLAACTAFGCYITVNAAWSVNPAQAYGKVLFYWVALGSACAAIAGLSRLGDRMLERVQRAVAVGVAVGAGYLLVETWSGSGIGRLLFSMVPALRPDPKHVQVADGWVASVQPYVLNRNVAALCLVIWPSLLILSTRGTRWLGLPLFAAAAAAVLASDHATSAIALVTAGLIFVAARFAPRLTRRVMAIGWVLATLLVVPIASLAFHHELQLARWLPETARNRIILWGYTAGEIAKAPVLGIGVASTRDLDAARASTAERPDGYTYPLRTGRHAHSIFMQTWYELGGIGAVLLCGIGLLAIRVLSRLPRDDQPAAVAAFVTVAMIGASSWGMWQTWFMAAYGIWAVLLGLALEGARRRRQRQAQPNP